MNSGDIENLKKLQEQYQLIPLHEFTKQPVPVHKDYLMPYQKFKQEDLGSAAFIGLLSNLLQYSSMNPAEKEMRARFAKIGIVPANTFNPKAYTPEVLQAINEGVQEAENELKEETDKEYQERIKYIEDDEGNNEALGATAGLFGNTKEEAVYIGTRSDKANNFLSGKNKYVIRFPKGQTPPNKYFWSITIYELPSRFLVSNPINRYSIGDRTTGLQYEPNGDLVIYMQHEAPKGKESNWLPTPANAFYYLIRIYGPEESILNGTWKAPQPELIKQTINHQP